MDSKGIVCKCTHYRDAYVVELGIKLAANRLLRDRAKYSHYRGGRLRLVRPS